MRAMFKMSLLCENRVSAPFGLIEGGGRLGRHAICSLFGPVTRLVVVERDGTLLSSEIPLVLAKTEMSKFAGKNVDLNFVNCANSLA